MVVFMRFEYEAKEENKEYGVEERESEKEIS